MLRIVLANVSSHTCVLPQGLRTFSTRRGASGAIRSLPPAQLPQVTGAPAGTTDNPGSPNHSRPSYLRGARHPTLSQVALSPGKAAHTPIYPLPRPLPLGYPTRNKQRLLHTIPITILDRSTNRINRHTTRNLLHRLTWRERIPSVLTLDTRKPATRTRPRSSNTKVIPARIWHPRPPPTHSHLRRNISK